MNNWLVPESRSDSGLEIGDSATGNRFVIPHLVGELDGELVEVFDSLGRNGLFEYVARLVEKLVLVVNLDQEPVIGCTVLLNNGDGIVLIIKDSVQAPLVIALGKKQVAVRLEVLLGTDDLGGAVLEEILVIAGLQDKECRGVNYLVVGAAGDRLCSGGIE